MATYSEISKNGGCEGAFNGFRTRHPEHGTMERRWNRPVTKWMHKVMGDRQRVVAAFTCEYADGARTTFVRHEPVA